MPATLQERWFARLYLAFPAAVLLLAAFWLLSGAIALARIDEAQAVLAARGVGSGLARAAVSAGAAVDLALGAAILWRPWTGRACLGMIAVSLCYLVGGTLMAADLWADPLGPLLKILPGIGLAAIALILSDER